MSNSEGAEVRLFDRAQIKLDKELGSGTFGKVYLATISSSTKSSQVAVKIFLSDLKKGKVTQKDRDDAYDELLKLSVIEHENIVKLHGIVAQDLPWLVFEYMKDGNLLEYVLKTKNVKEKTLMRYCRDICNGMRFLHNLSFLHKDLAARNILLNGKTAKISDLGLASFLTDAEDGVYALNGKLFPYRHAGKECIVEQMYTFESDVWSFGILMYEVFSGGKTPYGKENKQPDVRRFIAGDVTPLDILEPDCSSKMLAMMRYILVQRDKRPTFTSLYHSFQQLLKEKPIDSERSNENLLSIKNSTAFSAYHEIKSKGLSPSSSFSNLHNSSNSPPPPNLRDRTVAHSHRRNRHTSINLNVEDQFLGVGNNVHTQSTPNLLELETTKVSPTKYLQANGNSSKRADRNFLPVQSPLYGNTLSTGDYKSDVQSGQVEKKSQEKQMNLKPTSTTTHVNGHSDSEPRARANSYSTLNNSSLFDGFVQNRFTRKF